jgi:hypothetical protein
VIVPYVLLSLSNHTNRIIVRLLIPHMASWISTQSTNDTYILQQYMAQKICNTASTYCNGTNQQYEDDQACMDFVTGIDIGQWYRMGGELWFIEAEWKVLKSSSVENNLVCRQLHVPMVSLRPSVHCSHIGPSGGDMCIPRFIFPLLLR